MHYSSPRKDGVVASGSGSGRAEPRDKPRQAETSRARARNQNIQQYQNFQQRKIKKMKRSHFRIFDQAVHIIESVLMGKNKIKDSDLKN